MCVLSGSFVEARNERNDIIYALFLAVARRRRREATGSARTNRWPALDMCHTQSPAHVPMRSSASTRAGVTAPNGQRKKKISCTYGLITDEIINTK